MATDKTQFPVLESVSYVLSRSRFVHFHSEYVLPAVRKWGNLLQRDFSWEHPCHYFDGTAQTARWIFLLDVLNHCFWSGKDEKPWTVTYRGRDYSGYWALAAALKAAMESGVPLTDATYLSSMTRQDLDTILCGKGCIPLLDARLANVREAGEVLCSDWGGDIVRLMEHARGSAVQLVMQVVASFPSFRDEAEYKGRHVCFWKRAQLLVADLNTAFSGKGLGHFHDLHLLTAFADYKLPQVLRHLKIISYVPSLERRIDEQDYLEPGSEEEVEIRAVTLWAVEECRRRFQDLGSEVSSTRIDNWLWRLGQLKPFRQRPYHRCLSIFY